MKTLTQAFDDELIQARDCYRGKNFDAAMSHLATAHILGQRKILRHWKVHAAMLQVGVAQRNVHEVVGQMWRMSLIPLGHLTKRLPLGNPGHASVSAFAAMPVPPDLLVLLDREASRSQR